MMNISSSLNKTSMMILYLKLLDLTPIRLLALPIYSKNYGRPAFAPEDMMRTFVAMTLCGISSPSDWANDYLKDKSGFYAVIY